VVRKILWKNAEQPAQRALRGEENRGVKLMPEDVVPSQIASSLLTEH
jgi:hypothetical protein